MSRSFLAIITLLGLALSFSPAAQADWSFYTHPFKSSYNDVSFAVDPADHPHVLMFSDAVYHLYFNGTRWMSELIDNTSWEPEGAIAIDSRGHIHIFYRTVNWLNNPSNLIHAYYDGSSWTKSVIDNGAAWSPSVIVDSSDNPHLAYVSVNNELRYAKFTPQGWVVETIPMPGMALWFGGTSISLDRIGNAHITVSNSYLPREVFWITNQSGEWVSTKIGNGIYSEITLDGNGFPNIVYYSEDDTVFTHARYDGLQWNTEAILSSLGLQGSAEVSKILTDREGHINIFFSLYRDTSSSLGTIVFAHFDGNWITDFISNPDKNQVSPPLPALGKSKYHVLYLQGPATGRWLPSLVWASTADIKVVSIEATVPSASEKNLVPGQFTVRRTGQLTLPLDVNYSVKGTATNRLDYQMIKSPVSIPAGSSSTTLNVVPVSDKKLEALETVILKLLPCNKYRVSLITSSATVTINDQ